ncbi:MAG: histone deacetylase [Proteobacteria bacterium]|nr:histone deacetylase [Pseudomonadota bacterium]
MAIYTDPQTGQRREVDDLSRSTARSSSIGIIALLIALALFGWYFYGRVSPTVDRTNTGASTVTEPVTSPALPNASPTHPAPSPNPGP